MAVTRFEIEGQNTRCISGLSVCCEHLTGGRFISGMRSAAGRPYYQGGSDPMGSGRVSHLCGFYPVEAFALEINGISLHSHWRWIDAYSEATDSTTHGIVKLANEIVPVTVSVHTKMDGTGFFERWLSIQNQSDKPLALSHIEPMRGLLWYENDRREHGTDEPFTLTTLPYVNWGYEGLADKRAIPPGTFAIDSARGRSGWGVPWFLVQNNMSGEIAVGHLE